MGLEFFNPKVHRQGTGSGRQKNFFKYDFLDIESPIDAQIKDPDDLKFTFGKVSVIPWAMSNGSSCYSLLPFTKSLSKISPTLGACKNAIKTFGLGKLDVTTYQHPDFDLGLELEPIEMDKKNQYLEFLDNVTTKEGHKKNLENIFDDHFDNGNHYIEVVLTETLGNRGGGIFIHNSENCLYWNNGSKAAKALAISPLWDLSYIQKHGIDTIPKFPNYAKQSDGTLRTMIHEKEGCYNWYGRPSWVGCWMNAYRQFQDLVHLVKRGHKQFMAEVFMELENGDSSYEDPFDESGAMKAGFKNSTERAIYNYTTAGQDYSPIWQSERPHGASPAMIHEFNPNYNEGFFKEQNLTNRQAIFESTSWSERMLGNSVSEGLGSDAFMNDLKVRDKTVLQTYRDNVLHGYVKGLRLIAEWMNLPEIASMAVTFRTKNFEQGGDKGLKAIMDSFGVGVRAGVLTPTEQDEVHFRERFGLEGNENVDESWSEAGGFRNPITLRGDEESLKRQEEI